MRRSGQPKCDSCKADAHWIAYAAYSTDTELPHPTFARYPMPQFRGCALHLIAMMDVDRLLSDSTGAWLVQPIAKLSEASQ